MIKFAGKAFFKGLIKNKVFLNTGIKNFKFIKLWNTKQFATQEDDLNSKIDDDVLKFKIYNENLTITQVKELEKRLLSIINSNNKNILKNEGTELLMKLMAIITRNWKVLYNSDVIDMAAIHLFKELSGEDFPIKLVPEYLAFVFSDLKNATVKLKKNLPSNFVGDLERKFYAVAQDMSIVDIVLIGYIPNLFKNKVSEYFVPFLEKTIIKKLQDKKLDRILTSHNSLLKHYLKYASIQFLEDYFCLLSDIINENQFSINYLPFTLKYLIRLVNYRKKMNQDKKKINEIIYQFAISTKSRIFKLLREENSALSLECLMNLLDFLAISAVPRLIDNNEYLHLLILNIILNKVSINEHEIIFHILRISSFFDLEENCRERLVAIAISKISHAKNFPQLFSLFNFIIRKYKGPNLQSIFQALIIKFSILIIEEKTYKKSGVNIVLYILKNRKVDFNLVEVALIESFLKQTEAQIKKKIPGQIEGEIHESSSEEEEEINK